MTAPLAPAYGVGDVVYLRDAASIGFLEAVKIHAINRDGGDKWVYTIVHSGRSSQAPTFGERISHKTSTAVYYEEGELVDVCDAAALARTALQERLDVITSLIDASC